MCFLLRPVLCSLPSDNGKKDVIPISDVPVVTPLSTNYTVQLSLPLDIHVFWEVMPMYHQMIIPQNFEGSMPSLYRSRKPTGGNDSSFLGYYRNCATQHVKALRSSTTLVTLQWHSITSKETMIFSNTAVRTSNLTSVSLVICYNFFLTFCWPFISV